MYLTARPCLARCVSAPAAGDGRRGQCRGRSAGFGYGQRGAGADSSYRGVRRTAHGGHLHPRGDSHRRGRHLAGDAARDHRQAPSVGRHGRPLHVSRQGVAVAGRQTGGRGGTASGTTLLPRRSGEGILPQRPSPAPARGVPPSGPPGDRQCALQYPPPGGCGHHPGDGGQRHQAQSLSSCSGDVPTARRGRYRGLVGDSLCRTRRLCRQGICGQRGIQGQRPTAAQRDDTAAVQPSLYLFLGSLQRAQDRGRQPGALSA